MFYGSQRHKSANNMKDMLLKLVNKVYFVLRTVSAACILMIALILVIAAPIPQIIFHFKWCAKCWMPLGLLVFVSTCAAFILIIWGSYVLNRKLRHSGFLLLLVCVVGVGLYQYDKIVLILTSAFVFSISLLYFTLNEFLKERKIELDDQKRDVK